MSPLAAAAVDQLDAVTVRIFDEANQRAALPDAVRLAFRLDPLALQLLQARREVVDPDRDVPVARAELVRAAVVVEGQLEHRLLVADAVEVVRRLELAVTHDVEVARERETERLVERPALVRVRDPHHRVEKLSYDRDRIARALSSS